MPEANFTPQPSDESAASPEKTLHALVQGRVQGVGFRYFVVREARRLGLTGMVRNLADGRVEVFARGEGAALERLLGQLRRGPLLGRVDRVAEEWGVPVAPATDFTIGF